MSELNDGLRDLKAKRGDLEETIVSLRSRRAVLDKTLDTFSDGPAKIDSDAGSRRGLQVERSTLVQRIAELQRLVAKLDDQIEGRKAALPLYSAVFASDDLIPALRSQREHPVHTLLRRMFHEQEE
jgi:hypothetical protein